MAVSKEEYKAGLEPKAREVLEFLEATPSKGYTLMDVYGNIFSEEEKTAHLQSEGGIKLIFNEMQGWIDDFRQQGYVTSKVVALSILFSAVE
jgi:hypothetical protein